MQFVYVLPGRWVPTNPALVTGPVYARLARAAEAAGFGAIALDEHPAPSSAWRNGTGGHDCFDPFVGLGVIAGATSTIKLLTYLAVVPFRNPFFLAKEAATLDVLSGGRLLLGVGLGYMEAEFDALGVDFTARHTLFDEAIEVVKRAWTGEPVTYRGTHFDAAEIVAHPVPLQRPHPPIWIGGNGRRTQQRVASGAQGWMAMPVKRQMAAARGAPPLETVSDLRWYIDRLRGFADEAGRTDTLDVVHSMRDIPKDWPGHLAAIEEMADAGVTWATLDPPNEGSPEDAIAYIEEYGEQVISRLATAEGDRVAAQ